VAKTTNSTSRTRKLNPAEYAILVFGGATVIAREIGITRASVHKWKGYGHIPSTHHRELLEKAKSKKIDLTEKDIIHGRTIK
jgi:hypothetical protein